MNPKTIFKLHEPQQGIDEKHQKETYIFMFFSYGYFENQAGTEKKKKYIPLKYSTGKKIKPSYWEDRPYYRVKKNSFKEAELLNRRLDYLEDNINRIYHEFEQKGLLPTPLKLKEKLDLLISDHFKRPVRVLNDYISSFILEASQGKRKTAKNTRYRKQSIKNLQGFYVQFLNYQKSRSKTLNYEQITVDFLQDFIHYFKQKGYSQNTIARHVKHLRMIMRLSREEGLHDNLEIDNRRFKVRSVEVERIFLTEEELKRMYRLNLTDDPILEKVRDVFLIGCYLAQRYSDYRNIKKKMIVNLESDRKGIKILQSKTGKSVLIPLRPEADFLLEKYNYTLPHTYEQLINSKIQIVAKKAGISDLKKTDEILNGIRVSKSVPRYKLIKTHTARRSGCTNMYLANISINEIMAISGHQTVQDFLTYIRTTELQLANKLSGHPYFLNPQISVAK
jgi:integrase